MIHVLHHQRRPGPGRFSLEKVFSDIRACLPRDIETSVVISKYDSKGIWRRVSNTLIARRQQADVHHVTGDIHYLILGLRPNSSILTIADCVALHRSKGIRRFLLWALWYYLPIRRARVVTAISAFTRDELLQTVKCDPRKIQVVHCPLSASFTFTPARPQPDVPVVLQVGTGATKNVGRVIESLRGIRCRLWLVGPLSAEHQRLLEYHSIEYRNFVEVSDTELASLYTECDLVIFASTYEGFGLPIIEAQAVGRPVIASNRAALPEVAGGAAELVDPDNQRSISDAVSRLISDAALRERLVELGKGNVKRFDPRRIAEEYASIYRNVASGQSD